MGGKTQFAGWVIRQSDGYSVQNITTGPAQVTVEFLRLGTPRTPATLEQKTYRTSDGGFSYQATNSVILAQTCDPARLGSAVVAGLTNGTAILQVTNTAAASCVLSGYPKVGTSTVALRGAAGGTTDALVPIVLLRTGQTASAGIDQPVHSVPCPSNPTPSVIALPDGAELTGTSWRTSVNCQPVVHPFVAGATGSGSG